MSRTALTSSALLPVCAIIRICCPLAASRVSCSCCCFSRKGKLLSLSFSWQHVFFNDASHAPSPSVLIGISLPLFTRLSHRLKRQRNFQQETLKRMDRLIADFPPFLSLSPPASLLPSPSFTHRRVTMREGDVRVTSNRRQQHQRL